MEIAINPFDFLNKNRPVHTHLVVLTLCGLSLTMESIPRLAKHVLSVPYTPKYIKSCTKTRALTSCLMQLPDTLKPVFIHRNLQSRPSLRTDLIPMTNYSSSATARAGWFLGLGEKKQVLPDIVKAGDPVLHEPAQDVPLGEIGSERIQMIIDDMVNVMRKAPGVGLAAPQIGIPLKIIVLEDTNEYISYAPKADIKAQDRRPFDLLVIINPKLKKKGNKTALFFEGCLSVDGFRAVVERHLEVEVGGFDRSGKAIKVEASGWQARILQHEYDHLEGTLYVDKIVPRTFRTVENLDLPLATGCPKLGVR